MSSKDLFIELQEHESGQAFSKNREESYRTTAYMRDVIEPVKSSSPSLLLLTQKEGCTIVERG